MKIDHLEVKVMIHHRILDAKKRFENETDEKTINYLNGALDAYRDMLSSLDIYVENNKEKI